MLHLLNLSYKQKSRNLKYGSSSSACPVHSPRLGMLYVSLTSRHPSGCFNTNNSSCLSTRVFTHPPSAVHINRDLPAQQTLNPTAAQRNSISSYHATSLSLRYPYEDAFAALTLSGAKNKNKKFLQLQQSRSKFVSQQIPHTSLTFQPGRSAHSSLPASQLLNWDTGNQPDSCATYPTSRNNPQH